ncbi:hypothetical protein [Bartonella sp. DGB2]|uniref:hypothetical protein n=1 Tax=Bartonella sp. DGB2 TaxID=3388426 RepID=UPI0039903961
MPFPYRLGVYGALVLAAFMSGFFYGKSIARVDSLKSAVSAFRERSKITDEVINLSDFDLCRALGGLSDECTALVHGLDETTPSQ